MTTFDLAVLLLRLGVGLTFAAHGAQKAFGWWGGPGPERWQGALHSMGFRPVSLFLFASVAAELGGGLFLAFGLLTPFAMAVLLAQSVVIIFHVHWSKGFFSQQGGIEFPLALAAGAAAAGLLGAGRVSLDWILGLSYSDSLRIGLLVVGIVAGAVSLAVPRLAPRHEPTAHAS